jgi:hypothetical protein
MVVEMRFGLLLTLTATLLCAACSTSSPTNSPPTVETFTPPDPYVRLVNVSNTLQLQIAARQFVAPRGRHPAIWLVGVSHIGERKYFTALQHHLNEQTLVLFEGISNSPMPASSLNSQTNAEPERVESSSSKEKLSSLQVSMAETLGLAFQLEAIDYTRDNFVNSDLSIQEIREIVSQIGAKASFESLVQMMEGGSWLDTILQVVFRFLSASPKMQALSKLALMETIGEIQGDPGQMKGLPTELKQLLEVLIDRRNEKVIADMKLELAEMKSSDSIAIFYGTGHMPDLETRLRRELKYHPAGQLWFTAFSVDKSVAGITDKEHEFIRTFIHQQFQQIQSTEKP